eukprot:3493542-Rhodomonas_salina.2
MREEIQRGYLTLPFSNTQQTQRSLRTSNALSCRCFWRRELMSGGAARRWWRLLAKCQAAEKADSKVALDLAPPSLDIMMPKSTSRIR